MGESLYYVVHGVHLSCLGCLKNSAEELIVLVCFSAILSGAVLDGLKERPTNPV